MLDYRLTCSIIIHMRHVMINHQDFFGGLWAIGWLFTIGYLDLKFWKGVLALFIWPYYIGTKFKNPLMFPKATVAPLENK